MAVPAPASGSRAGAAPVPPGPTVATRPPAATARPKARTAATTATTIGAAARRSVLSSRIARGAPAHRPAATASCSATGEECDDGNAIQRRRLFRRSARRRPAITCNQPPLGDTMRFPVVYRDFKFSRDNTDDFELGVTGSYLLSRAWSTRLSMPMASRCIRVSAARPCGERRLVRPVVQRRVRGNHSTPSNMTLWNNGQGGYVNRYGANGEQWNTTAIAYYCGNVGAEKTDAPATPSPARLRTRTEPTTVPRRWPPERTLLTCYKANGSYTATFIVSKADGNPLFSRSTATPSPPPPS